METKQRSKLKREWLALGISLVLLAGVLLLLTALLTPKRHNYGSTWGHYLAEPEQSVDALVLGSSLAYCDVVPAEFWRETGLSAYVMAGGEQTLPMSYYYLKECLKTQSPQVVFVEITGLFYPRYTSFTKINVGMMPWGRARLEATFQEAEPELRAGLLFPLVFYHDRWKELTRDDFRYTLGGYGPDLKAGYTYLNQYRPAGDFYTRNVKPDWENIERNYEFLEKIWELCRQRGVTPVFYVTPVVARMPAEEMDALKARLAELEGAFVVDFNEEDRFDAIGLDRAVDFYDDLHLNLVGAVKFTAALAAWEEEHLALTANGTDAALWQSRADHLDKLLETPMRER